MGRGALAAALPAPPRPAPPCRSAAAAPASRAASGRLATRGRVRRARAEGSGAAAAAKWRPGRGNGRLLNAWAGNAAWELTSAPSQQGSFFFFFRIKRKCIWKKRKIH